jgi:RIO-like serine/threonine protein kinase
LKKGTFGQVRLEYRGPDRVIMRDLGPARWWVRDVARRLLAREARALAILDGEPGVPTLLDARRDTLVRAFIEGAPMHDARPQDPAYFRQAGKLLRRLHRLGVVHNDLAKEANWLVTSDGQPAVVDFQLAWCPPRRSRLFRLLAREDLRHLLKHKRTYCPMRLTTRERHILGRPSVPSRVWMRTGKPLYLLVTRRILGWADREGAADR